MKPLLSLAAAFSLFALTAHAADNQVFYTSKKLTASQFVSNCAMQGGTPTNTSSGGSLATGGTTINCTKKNGTNIDCAFDQDGATCVGTGPKRPN